jgi:predicted nucleic acid-binding protein
MVLIDTSVWIRFFTRRAPHTTEVDRLLRLDQVTGHELVYGELLIGDAGGRAKFLAHYTRYHQTARVPHQEVVAFVREHKLHGRGVGWIDVNLLASAIAGGCRLWTADSRLAELAAKFDVAYDPSESRPFLI